MTTTTATRPGVLASPGAAWLRRKAPLLIVYGLILLMLVYGTLNSDRFLTDRNLLNVLRQCAFLGMLAIAETFVILTGGIDLSVGSVVKLSVLVSAIVMNGASENTLPAIVVTLALGALIGVIHGVAVTRLNIAPFIVTLGTYSIIRGVSLLITTTPVGRASPEVVTFYDQKWLGVFALIWLFVVLLLISIFVLRRTAFGRYIYAVGGSEQVARLSGLPVNRVKMGVYILCSLLASLTGLMLLSRYGVGDPVVGDGLELQAITAVILGGTSLFGGRGGMVGTVGGVILLVLTGNLLVVLNANQWIRELIQGAVILIAVALYKQKGK
jgi:ribose/xylose/arabinose/galactoside ABC-type transport system permease subunit